MTDVIRQIEAKDFAVESLRSLRPASGAFIKTAW
jgi:hypothetical protein